MKRRSCYYWGKGQKSQKNCVKLGRDKCSPTCRYYVRKRKNAKT